MQYKDFLKRKGNHIASMHMYSINPDLIMKALGYQEKIAGSKAIIVFYL